MGWWWMQTENCIRGWVLVVSPVWRRTCQILLVPAAAISYSSRPNHLEGFSGRHGSSRPLVACADPAPPSSPANRSPRWRHQFRVSCRHTLGQSVGKALPCWGQRDPIALPAILAVLRNFSLCRAWTDGRRCIWRERWHADASHGARHHLWVGAGHHPWGVADTASGTGGVAVWVGHCQGKACPPLDLRHLLNSRNLVRLGSLRVRAVDFGPDDPTQCCHRRFVTVSNFADDSFHSSLLGTYRCMNLVWLLRRLTMSSGSVAPMPCARFLD